MLLSVVQNRLGDCELQAATAKRLEHQRVILDDFIGAGQRFRPSSVTHVSVKLMWLRT